MSSYIKSSKRKVNDNKKPLQSHLAFAYVSHKLKKMNNQKGYQLKIPIYQYAFISIFIIAGLFILSFSLFNTFNPETIIGIIVSSIFLGAAYYQITKMKKTESTFDMERKLFYHGNSYFDSNYDTRFDRIKQIQLIQFTYRYSSEDTHDGSNNKSKTMDEISKYFNYNIRYQLNFVLTDNSRRLITTSKSRVSTQENMLKISKILNIPSFDYSVKLTTPLWVRIIKTIAILWAIFIFVIVGLVLTGNL